MLHALIENARPSSARRRRAHAQLGRVRPPSTSARRRTRPAATRSPTAIRTVTGSSLRLAYALAEDDAQHGRDDVPPLSEDELIDTFMREFDAEELPAEEES